MIRMEISDGPLREDGLARRVLPFAVASMLAIVLMPLRAIGEESASYFRGLLESAPDAIVIVDETGAIVFVNAMAQLVFGYSNEELLGSSIELLVPERSRSDHRARRDRYVSEGVTERPMNGERDVVARRKDGTEFPADVRLSPVETDSGTFIISSLRDITERRRIEANLRRLAGR